MKCMTTKIKITTKNVYRMEWNFQLYNNNVIQQNFCGYKDFRPEAAVIGLYSEVTAMGQWRISSKCALPLGAS